MLDINIDVDIDIDVDVRQSHICRG